MKIIQQICVALIFFNLAFGQPTPREVASRESRDIVVVTGVRFSYPILQKWIDDYKKVKPDVQIIIESRGTTDPLLHDILAEVHGHEEDFKKERAYLYVGRYAVLPVATAGSAFAEEFSDKGLNASLISQIFFDDMFADRSKQKQISAPFHVYTRLQKAGIPFVFAKHFGQEQKNIKGEAIAGSDIHLLKATLRDSIGVTYLPLPLIYDMGTRQPVQGLTILPVDVDGNKKVSDNEKFYDNLETVFQHLEALEPHAIKNIPVAYLHLSIDRNRASTKVIDFLEWINENGSVDLHDFGYLRPEDDRPPFKTQ